MNNKKLIYLDHAATTYLREEVKQEILPFLDINYGNASSLYTLGQISNKAIEKAREQVAKALNADNKEIIFTSGGTESDNLALQGIIKASKTRKHIITSKIEHPAILRTCKELEKEGCKVSYINVNKYGVVNLEELEKSINENTILVSIMFANNEVGTIQPIKEIGNIVKEASNKYSHKIYFHTDAVQAVGKVPINVNELNIDLLSISAHKIYGPKGIGALYIRKGTDIKPIIIGGGHEKGLRAGTENVPGIVGLGKAIELANQEMKEVNNRLINLRDHLIKNILEIPYTQLNGEPVNRLPNNVNISINFIEGEGLILMLDDYGICASTGSACSSKSLEPSHVLLAMGIPHEIAHGSLRLSLGIKNTKEEIDYVIEVLPKIVKKLRDISPLSK